MTDTERVPDGVVDAYPPGGWASRDSVDSALTEADRAAQGSPDLVAGGDPPAGEVETDDASRGLDPDLAADEEQEES